MKLNRILLAVCIVALACMNAHFLMGQTTGGALVGTVHDPSGAVIPKANVTLTNTATGVALTTVSTSAGAYNFPLVPAGPYKLTVSAAGFQQTESQNIEIDLDKTATDNVQLQVGAASSTVQVQAATTQLETASSQNATTIDAQTFEDLPFALNGGARSVTAVATIMPGVSLNDGASYQSPGTAGSQQFAQTINGGQAWGGAQMYDGIPMVTTNTGGTYTVQPVPVEALSEFALIENNFNPELGQTPGGIMSFNTRAGTNAFHGQAYEYLRNNALDAAGYFAPGPGTAPVTRQNEFGVNVGGPILIPHVYNGKDKLFFYAFYSGFRLAGSSPYTGETLPTLAEQGGDFTGLINSGSGTQIPIYDPKTINCNAAGNCTRQQYDYNGVPNTINPATISAPALAWNKYLPAPQNSLLTGNYYASGLNNANENRYGGRVDFHPGQNDQVYGFFALGHILTSQYSYSFLPPMNPYGGSISPNDVDLARLGWDHTFTPNLILHLGAGWNRQGETSIPPYTTPIDYGIPNGVSGVTPSIYFLTGSYADNGGSGGSLEKEHAFAYTGFISWTKGKNQFKLGGLYYQARAYNLNVSSGVLRLLPDETTNPATPQTRAASGDPYASLVAGAFDSYSTSDSPFAVDNQFKYAAAYFNDDYKIMPNLVLNLGVRYEIPWTITTKNNIASMFSPDVANTAAGGLPGALIFQGNGQYRCQCKRLVPTRYVFWQPRVGFAYSVNNKTVVRGNYGLFLSLTGSTGTENGYSTQFSDGYNASYNGASSDGGNTPIFYSTVGYPPFTPPPFIDPTFDNQGVPIWALKSTNIPGVISNYTLSVQRELPKNFVLDIAYVGNTAQHISSGLFLPNQLPLGDEAEYGEPVLSSRIDSAVGMASGVPIPYPNFVADYDAVGVTPSVAQALRAFPQYQKVTSGRENQGHSTYNSLQVKLQRQFRNGFSTLVSYTWAKQMTNAEDESPGFNDYAQDTYSRIGEFVNAYDQAPNTLSITYVYDLPFGTGRRYMNHGIVGAIAGGWGLSAIQRYSSGSPMYQIGQTTPFPSLGAGGYRPNYAPGVSQRPAHAGKFNPRVDPQINAAAFVQPVGLEFGNVAKNLSLRSYGFYDEAFSARKDFHIWESTAFQFRTDFFNAFNRSNFDSINGNTGNPESNTGFGIFTSQGNSPRSIQFAAKVIF